MQMAGSTWVRDPPLLLGERICTMRKMGSVAMTVLALTLPGSASFLARPVSTRAVPQGTTAMRADSAVAAGWVPVAYHAAQVSVPVSFWVFYPGQTPLCTSLTVPGALLIAPTPRTRIGPDCSSNIHAKSKASGYETTVSLIPISRVPPAYAKEKPVVLNGVLVYLGAKGVSFIDYYAPSLGIELAANGILARRVAETLSRSPRTTVLATAKTPSVPATWHSASFAGLRFSFPASWPVIRTQLTTGLGSRCGVAGVALSGTTVTFSTDLRPFLEVPCAYIPQSPEPPTNGVQVDSGLLLEPRVTLAFSSRCLRLHSVTACPATSPGYSILVLRVKVPGRTTPVFVSIGIAGSGAVARTILYSLAAA